MEDSDECLHWTLGTHKQDLQSGALPAYNGRHFILVQIIMTYLERVTL